MNICAALLKPPVSTGEKIPKSLTDWQALPAGCSSTSGHASLPADRVPGLRCAHSQRQQQQMQRSVYCVGRVRPRI